VTISLIEDDWSSYRWTGDQRGWANRQGSGHERQKSSPWRPGGV